MKRLRLDFIDYTTEIEAPCDEVFAFFTDIERWPSWASGIKHASRIVPGTEWGVGFKIEFAPRFLPVPIRTKVLTYTKGRVIEWGLRTPIASLVHRFDFEPLGKGRCRVRHTECAQGLLAITARPMKKRIGEFDMRLAEDLKAAFKKR